MLRCAVTSIPSQTVACFIRDLYHELDGDNAEKVNLEWMKRQPLFQDMDFDKVGKHALCSSMFWPVVTLYWMYCHPGTVQ